MVIVNSILITLLVVGLIYAIVSFVRDTKNLKEEWGTLVGLIVWLLVVIAIGFQELPWLRKVIEKPPS